MATAPTPPARECVPMSFHSTHATRANSPYSSGSSFGSVFPPSSAGGSDTNLSQVYSSNGSMRRQLLQRLWSREFQRFNRTGSVSPPMQRSQRTRNAWRHMDAPSGPWIRPNFRQTRQCIHGQSSHSQAMDSTAHWPNPWSAQHFNRSVPEITSKRAKFSKLSSSFSSFKQKSHSIETETVDLSQSERSECLTAADTSERMGTNDSNFAANTNASHDIDENRNFIASEVGDSDDVASSTATNMFQIEMDGDQINIITTTTTTTPPRSTDTDSTAREHRPTNNESRSSEPGINYQSTIRSEVNSNHENDVDAVDAANEIGECVAHVAPSTTTTISIDQSTLDSFISQILVDSLNNIIVVEGKVSGPSSNDDNNLSGVLHSVSSQTQTDTSMTTENHFMDVDESDAPADAAAAALQQKIYFPKYATDDSLSEYSAKYSNESTTIELPAASIVISVISGSAYPLDGGELIVHRFAQMPRTESMEVRPSSGSAIGDNDDNRDDDNVSVDSLDDPAESNRGVVVDETHSTRPIEKSKAFFVPMDNDNDQDASAEQETPDIIVGYAMPERLRDRLERRQMEMSRRKEYEMKRKQEKIQRIIDQFENKSAITDESSGHSDIFDVVTATAEAAIQETRPSKSVISKRNTTEKGQYKSEVGLLQSYTIDAQGNLLFKEPQKVKAAGSKKAPPTTKRATAKASATKSIAARKPREIVTTKVVAVKRTNAIAVKPISNSRHRNNSRDSIVGRRTDLQKMTLYHHSPAADMVTPDADCGPRRMYQKTEIHDGKKRIEILEIVECANSSPDSLATSTSPTSSATTASTTKSSKIPVPVLPLKRSSTRPTNGHHRQSTSPSPPPPRRKQSQANASQLKMNASQCKSTKNYAKSLHQMNNNNSKMDQIIADLLIEALNSSTDIGIEFVKTPQQGPNISVHNQSSLIKVSNTKRVCAATAATSTTASSAANARRNSGGKRSAHSSGKYQQVFDAIPEEKSNLSVDSPESAAEISNSILNSSHTSDTVSTSIVFAQENSVESNDGSANAAQHVDRAKNGQARGKEAVHSDQEKPEAWFGCFGQRHNESPVDPLLLDEGIFKVIHKSSVLV